MKLTTSESALSFIHRAVSSARGIVRDHPIEALVSAIALASLAIYRAFFHQSPPPNFADVMEKISHLRKDNPRPITQLVSNITWQRPKLTKTLPVPFDRGCLELSFQLGVWCGEANQTGKYYQRIDAKWRIIHAFLSKSESLDLSDLQLETLPECISLLTDLKSINASNCFLKLLPARMERLTKLESLDLSWNWLTEFPSDLTKLPALKKLILTANEIAVFPENTGSIELEANLNAAG